MFAVRNFCRPSVVHSTRIHTKAPTHNESHCAIKQRIDTHVIHQFGEPKLGATHGYEPEFVMVRALQRYPNAGVRDNLYRLHACMAQRFSGMSDEALDWLLGGARLTSRGGFHTPTEFRKFLETNDLTLFTPAQLISQLEHILTSIGYRARNVETAEPPTTPQTPAQKEMYQLVCDITNGQVIRTMSEVYPEKTTCWISDITGISTLDDVIVCEQDDDLSDDEDNLFRGKPSRRIPDAYYKAVDDDGHATWMAQARERSVPIRSHISGTGPICMAAAVGLLSHSGACTPFSNKQEAWDLFSALFIPKYLRSDYHSIAETFAGMTVFIEENVGCALGGSPGVSTPMSPMEAQERAYEAMCNAACDEHQEFGVTPSEAMKDYQALLAMQRKAAQSE